MNIEWIIMPLSGGVIGYFTNWLAIKMLFRPFTEKRIGKFRVPMTPGLIPKERGRLTEKIAETLTEYVLTDEVLENSFKSDEMKENITKLVKQGRIYLEESNASILDFFGEDIKINDMIDIEKGKDYLLNHWEEIKDAFLKWLEKNPKIENSIRDGIEKIAEEQIGSFVGIFISYDKIYDKVKNNLLEYLDNEENRMEVIEKIFISLEKSIRDDGIFSQLLKDKPIKEWMALLSEEDKIKMEEKILEKSLKLLGKGASLLAHSLDIKKLVVDEINKFETEEIEEITLSVVDKELKMITWVGGVLGFVIGFLPLLWEKIMMLI